MPANKRGRLEIGVGAVLVTLAATSVALRFGARWRRRLDLWVDDWLALIGQVSERPRSNGTMLTG